MMLLIPFIIFSTLFIQGCITTTVVGITAAIGTKIAIDPRTINTQISDSILELRIKKAFFKKKLIRNDSRIIPIVYQGKLLLIGQTTNKEILFQSEKIAKKIQGVLEIYNEIRNNKPINIISLSSDTWITKKIQSKILTSELVKISNLKIITEDGEVFIFGTLTKNEGRIVANIIRNIKGVKRIITIFNYIM